ncbi:hypothetical protein CAI16_13310 [Virgibacillus dokdonensis]|uniref:Uncharacterized protein n=1 Tax=Virgibacillus dokdonensis TaxID=302167 RepID=A0A3E0WN37_9BACI|nr:hypothetical protein CAI16_13310 [Virgibacillus dokdonensis]
MLDIVETLMYSLFFLLLLPLITISKLVKQKKYNSITKLVIYCLYLSLNCMGVYNILKHLKIIYQEGCSFNYQFIGVFYILLFLLLEYKICSFLLYFVQKYSQRKEHV